MDLIAEEIKTAFSKQQQNWLRIAKWVKKGRFFPMDFCDVRDVIRASAT